MTEFAVSEVFSSIQGEGLLQGMPSTFIRLAFCNLACSWCDAAYTWRGDVKHETVELDELLARAEFKHVVLTGGEPTYSDGFCELVAALADDGHHVTVETNGTILKEAALEDVDLWSLSPKLGSSMQAGSLRTDVVAAYLTCGKGAQLKYVVDGEQDFQDVIGHLKALKIENALDGVPVFVQPNGLCHIAALKYDGHTLLTDTTIAGGPRTVEIKTLAEGVVEATVDVTLETEYLDRVRWLYERVVEAETAGELPCFMRAVVQAHKLAWGNRRGF